MNDPQPVWSKALIRLRDERGQAITELAVAVPLLLLVLFGVIDFSRAINYQNDQTNLANLGARVASVGVMPSSGPCSSSADLATYVSCQAGLDAGELKNGNGTGTGIQTTSGSGITVCVNAPNNTVGQPVQVKVTSSFKWLPGPLANFGTSSIAGSASMRIESPIPSSWITSTSATGC